MKEQERRGEEEKLTALIKSNNSDLAGGEQSTKKVMGIGLCALMFGDQKRATVATKTSCAFSSCAHVVMYIYIYAVCIIMHDYIQYIQ